MSEEKFGIEETKKVFGLLYVMANAGDKMGHESKWKDRLPYAMPVVLELAKLPSVDWAKFPKEMGDLDAAELVELKKHMKDSFDLVDDELEYVIEDIVGLVPDVVVLVKRLISIGKR